MLLRTLIHSGTTQQLRSIARQLSWSHDHNASRLRQRLGCQARPRGRAPCSAHKMRCDWRIDWRIRQRSATLGLCGCAWLALFVGRIRSICGSINIREQHAESVSVRLFVPGCEVATVVAFLLVVLDALLFCLSFEVIQLGAARFLFQPLKWITSSQERSKETFHVQNSGLSHLDSCFENPDLSCLQPNWLFSVGEFRRVIHLSAVSFFVRPPKWITRRLCPSCRRTAASPPQESHLLYHLRSARQQQSTGNR